MAILNYTTTVAVAKTIGEIIEVLARHGARRIEVDYAAGVPTALAFHIVTPLGDFRYRLPARIDRVGQALARQAKRGDIPAKYGAPEHAARVGWRIVKDWIEAQVAMIDADAMTIDEAMLPFHLVEEHTTVYDAFVRQRTALPPAGSGDR